jgi:predicted GIY-YIG superfamily endonuclease
MIDARGRILRCTDGSLYTGWTVDLERRLRAIALARRVGTRPVGCQSSSCAIPMSDRTKYRRGEARIKTPGADQQARAEQ